MSSWNEFPFFLIEYIAILLLTLSAFRLPIRYSLHKILFIATAMSVVYIYIRHIQSDFALLPTFTVEMILLMLFFRLPLIFSFLVVIIGVLTSGAIEALILYIETSLKIASLNYIMDHYYYVQLPTTVVLLLLTAFLQRRKIGFHFTMQDSLKGYNFYLSAILVISVMLIQFATYSVNNNSSYNLLIPSIISIILVLAIFLSYKHNKKLWKERRERLEKKR
ncbi:hypothetical protein SAMN02799630_00771 [Paenibacillus sp. UNCCL117]|uniref:hypothetical protein n=1 Tax=unclassified Paenibacillus TaxID=185978 RepID=UPI0008873CC0|nr:MULTISPECIES: hypothetical protein [unclassified Paenibacillus]SDC19664.1 hypothetical protein SAMN04488602_101571 [Paenibacillus sp. cl123]SFW18454.1 hypothetical protein SAMN02799630_00771 [Paenibacillus sp. UNCCL117]